MTRTTLTATLLFLTACPGEILPLPDGDFEFSRAEPDGTAGALEGTLSVDTEALTLTFTDADAVQEWNLVPHEASDLYTDCYTNYTHATMDTYDIAGDVTLGGVAIERPVLTSMCGGDLLVGTWSVDGGTFDGTIFYFAPAE